MTAIVLQIPEDLKLLCAPIEALLRAVASRVERARQGCCETAAMEQEFTALTAAIECAAHAPVLAALDLEAPLLAVDGVRHRLAPRIAPPARPRPPRMSSPRPATTSLPATRAAAFFASLHGVAL